MKSKVKRYDGTEESEVYYDKDEDSAAQEVTSSTKNQQAPSSSTVSKAPIATALRKAKAEPAPEKETPKIGTGRFASLPKKADEPRKFATPTEARRNESLNEQARQRMEAERNPGPAKPEKRTGRFASLNMKSGGKVSSASNRADGCAVRGKTRGKMV
jgi:hypothetical protein